MSVSVSGLTQAALHCVVTLENHADETRYLILLQERLDVSRTHPEGVPQVARLACLEHPLHLAGESVWARSMLTVSQHSPGNKLA